MPLRPRPLLLLALAAALLSGGCGGGAGSSASPSTAALAAAFAFSPASPAAGQTVSFRDASAGTPTTWAWSFGDGGTSSLRNPTHAYASAGSYTVTLSVGDAAGSSRSASQPLTVAAATGSPVNVVLGRPTGTSIQASLYSAAADGSAFLEYGTTPGSCTSQSAPLALAAGTPQTVTLTGLAADTAYAYRVAFRAAGDTAYARSAEYRFHTARAAGSSFTFCLQADPHLDENANLDVYRTTLANALADAPDFYVDLGDTFMCEKHTQPFDAAVQPAPDWPTVLARYRYERGNFGLIAHSAPLFLVNGNHEGEAGWLQDGTDQCLPVWTTRARQQYFLNPTPDAFYTGDSAQAPFVGQRASYYAWTWGSALFVVLDPFWATGSGGSDGWAITLGRTQYDWLASTLAASSAPFKFVFIHNLVGGLVLGGNWRGGVEAAPFFEWGGRNLSGQSEFAARRPGWALPIHELLRQYRVTAVFHGHDHLYARQDLDGIVYQEVPQPSSPNYLSGPTLASQYAYAQGTILGSSGHLRVTVGPDHATAQYVRAYRPTDETDLRRNGQVDDSWTVGAPGWPTAIFGWAPATPLVGQSVAFTDASTGSPLSWAWDFGDGATSTLASPTHSYGAAGTYTVKLTVTNAVGGHAATRGLTVAAGFAPAAGFSFSPGAPVAGQRVSFTDTSTQSPTAWSWDFGDGSARSTAQNPTHAYAAAGSYTVTLKATNAFGSAARKQSLTVSPASPSTGFAGTLVLGSPTATSVKANLHAPAQGGTVLLAWGTQSGVYTQQTAECALQAGTPLELTMDGLSPDTAYVYRLSFKAAGAAAFTPGEECGFHTARAPGGTFVFGVQGDSHPERAGSQFDGDLYARTLAAAAADRPDFYVMLGDDFSVDTLDPLTVTQAQVLERYALQRPYLGPLAKNAPLFLVNGNHEQAARYLLDGTPNNVAVWAQNARNALYSQPAPDGFYTGNTEVVPYIGPLRNTFAWTWGDALFVTLDPYWASPACVDNPFDGGPKRTNLWDVTHGDAQYQWLRTTLESSKARYKFVFAHHVMGTGRGGVELAPLYEWGGHSGNGAWDFGLYRPSWGGMPLHQLMAANRVTVFFQGHDHIWVRQELDGVTYQTLPEPADPTYTLWNADAFLAGDKVANSGYARVTVGPSGVKVEYVRTWLPKDETGSQVNGQVAAGYTLP